MLKLIWVLILVIVSKTAQGQWRRGGGGNFGGIDNFSGPKKFDEADNVPGPEKFGGHSGYGRRRDFGSGNRFNKWKDNEILTNPNMNTIISPGVTVKPTPTTSPTTQIDLVNLSNQAVSQNSHPYFGFRRRPRFGNFRRYPFYAFNQPSHDILSDSDEFDNIPGFNANFAKCGCVRKHPQTAFCEAAFVITGMPVQKVGLGPFTAMYRINVGNKLKITPEAEDTFQRGIVRIYTDRTDCAAKLKKYTQYFITGSIKNGLPFINICDFVRRSSNMTAFQKDGFFGKYEENCDECEVQNCNTIVECKKTPPKEVCLVDRRKYPPCRDDFGICTKIGTACKWNKSPDIARCLAKQK